MDSLPLELFGLITAYCSAELLLKLEYVCKSWKENLGEQWIWKQVATNSTSGFQLPEDIESWKEVALKGLFTIKNMTEKRCITRSFASAEYTRGYSHINHCTSVEGDEALISWFSVQQNNSYYTSAFITNEMVNITTGKRSAVPTVVPSRCALLTKNFIVTSKGNPENPFACTKELFLVDRRTNETSTIIIPGITKGGSMMKNVDSTYKNGSMLAIRNDNNKSYVIVDLENRTTQTIDMGNAIAVKLDNYFHGKYLAIGRTFRRGSEHSGKMQIQIYDIEAGANKIIYDKMKHEGDWCIADDRIVCVNASKTNVRATITDFSDKIIGKVTTTKILEEGHTSTSVRLYGDILLVVASNRAWFIDVKHSKLLCSLQLIGWSDYGKTYLHNMIGTGKFVMSSVISTRLIDFESIAIIKEFKPQIILPEHDFGVVESWKRPIAFHELMDFAREVIGDDTLTKYASVKISQDDEANERTSLIYLASKYFNQDVNNEPENQKATELRASNKAMSHRAVNMVFLKFEYDATLVRAHIDFLNSPDKIKGRAILYKEKFIHGEWIPVDF